MPNTDSLNFSANLVPRANETYELGSANYRWGSIYTNNINNHPANPIEVVPLTRITAETNDFSGAISDEGYVENKIYILLFQEPTIENVNITITLRNKNNEELAQKTLYTNPNFIINENSCVHILFNNSNQLKIISEPFGRLTGENFGAASSPANGVFF